MEKLYLDLAYVSAIPEAYRRPAAAISSISGENLGNFAFRYALQYIVEDFSDYRPVLYTEAYGLASRNQVERVLVSCANWLSAGPRDEDSNAHRCRAFEAMTVPVVCFGLGVQANLDSGIPKLGPNTERLAKVLSERAEKISVRDHLTQETLDSIGVTNTTVTGCPSNFINGDRELGAKISARARRFLAKRCEWATARSMIAEYSGGHAWSGRVLSEHLRVMGGSAAFYILQSPQLLPYLFGESEHLLPFYKSNSPFAGNEDRLASVLRSRSLSFSSIEGWLDFSRTCDLAFGMRIHGIMLPLQAGVPAALIGHDSRTTGLAQLMGVPLLTPQSYCTMSGQGPKTILSFVADQMLSYDERRRGLARTMTEYLIANNLKPAASLAGLTDSRQDVPSAPALSP